MLALIIQPTSFSTLQEVDMRDFNLIPFSRIRLVVVAGTLAGASILSSCAGISGHQTVMNRMVVPGGKFQNMHVDCPAGKKVLGGGFNIETPDDIKIFSSEPSDGRGNLVNHSWNVYVHNAGTQDRQTTVIAVCAR